MGEFLFLLVKNSEKTYGAMEDITRRIDHFGEELQKISRDSKLISHELQEQRQAFAEFACDTKDINQNIYRFVKFLESIEKELDLKR
jgi:uncharacterized protein YukE